MWDSLFTIAEAQPDAPALIGPHYSYTYSQFIAKAQTIASEFQGRGLDNECIGIALEDKSNETLVATAVLLSGNFFFFIPHHSTSEFLDQVPVALLVSDIFEISSFACPGVSWENLDSSSKQFKPWWKDRSNLNTRGFCVFSTSGSTGKPKYVFHDYQSIMEDTHRQIEENQIGPADRIDFLFAASFSSSLASIFPSILSGAGLVVMELAQNQLAEVPLFWKKHCITFTTLTSSAFRMVCKLYDSNLQDFTPSIRFICLGGEKILPSDVQLIRSNFPKETVIQLAYASTETRTVASLKIQPGIDESFELHDGFPVRNKTLKIISQEHTIVNPHEIGEIQVHSEFISLGYWKNKCLDLHPISGDNRIYATGDRASWTPKGAIKLVGRTHSIQKVNGVLIDFLKVEEAIQHIISAGNACKVMVLNDSKGLEYLVAFLEGESESVEQRIRQELGKNPSLALVPRQYVFLAQFPLNTHGKIDTDELIKLAKQQSASFVNTQISDPTRRMIVAIWSRELEAAVNDLNADFFTELGGSSLLAEFVASEIEANLGKPFSSDLIFSLRTVNRIANYLNLKELPSLPLLEIHSQIHRPQVPWILFIDTGFNNSFQEILRPLSLLGDFNIAILRTDHFKILKTQNPEQMVAELAELTKQLSQVTYVASSFNGLLAAKIAELKPGQVVMLDTPCYHVGSDSLLSQTFLSRSKYIFGFFRQKPLPIAIRESLRMVFQALAKKLSLDKSKPSLFQQSVQIFLLYAKPLQRLDNLLYIYSERSLMTSAKDLQAWKKKACQNFKLLRIDGGHLDAASTQFGSKVAREISQFVGPKK